jgi:transposase
MPTIARRPTAQQERDRLQARRLRAAEPFAAGVRQAEVARQLGVSGQSVHLWYRRWQAEGTNGLRSRARPDQHPGCPTASSSRWNRPC